MEIKCSKIRAIFIALALFYAVQPHAAINNIEIVDMAGRKVTIPEKIDKIISYDSQTNVMLFPIAEKKLKAIAKMNLKTTFSLIHPDYNALPKLDVRNVEEIISYNPDIIIASFYGTPASFKKFNKLQKRLRIPIVLIRRDLESIADSYAFLGKLLNAEKQAQARQELITRIFNSHKSLAKQNNQGVKGRDGQEIGVFYSVGMNGLMTDPIGSPHTKVFDLVGINTVADIKGAGKGHVVVNIEQVIKWNPTYIFAINDQGKGKGKGNIYASPKWAGIDAVKNNQIYHVPYKPFGWTDQPPSVNRVLGISWLDHIFHGKPKKQLKEEVKEFYRLFYKYDLSELELAKLLDKKGLSL